MWFSGCASLKTTSFSLLTFFVTNITLWVVPIVIFNYLCTDYAAMRTTNEHLNNNIINLKPDFQMKKLQMLFAATILLTSTVFAAGHIKSDASVAIIPYPSKVEMTEGVFKLTPATKIALHFDDEKLPLATNFLNSVAEDVFGSKLAIVKADKPIKKNAINVTLNKSLHEEGYTLEVTPSVINISASTAHGVFYAFQSLRQMLPVEALTAEGVKSVAIAAAKIEDAPHFPYRGIMFDVCRHFFTVDEVKTVIDMAAMHKLNRLHWHLTEDQGWRIEIKKYPLLTEIGSKRADSQVVGTHRVHGEQYEGKPYGPYFYTQDEIRDVVKYAADRFITIIPEIDMPGHMVAALASYPHLGCVGKGYKVRELWGISKEVMCIGKDTTFEFIEGVLEEVVSLFPSEYIHIGGDEAPRDAWKACPACQARMKAEELNSEAELQSYFTQRVENFLKKHGRRIIGWDEILEGGVSPTTTVMSWRGSKGGIKAAKAGNQVIMSPHTHCYLDYPQGADRTKEPPFGERRPEKPHYLPLEQVYRINPYDQLTEEEQKYIIGVQGNLWTEHVNTFDLAMYMFLPRTSAIAEAGWSHTNKSFKRYITNLNRLVSFYDAYGYNYAKSYWRELGK